MTTPSTELRRCLGSLVLFWLPVAALVVGEQIALVRGWLTFRVWEQLVILPPTRHPDPPFPGPFYPRQAVTRYEEGDLGHRTPLAAKRRVRWQTDAYGYRNDETSVPAQVVIVGDSMVAGSSLDQSQILSTRLAQDLSLPVINLAPASVHAVFSQMRFFDHRPRVVVQGISEQQLTLTPSCPGLPPSPQDFAGDGVLDRLLIWWWVTRDRVQKQPFLEWADGRVNDKRITSFLGRDHRTLFHRGDQVHTADLRAVDQAIRRLASCEAWLAGNGIAFLPIVIPDKETIYWDLLPSGRKSGTYRRALAGLAAAHLPTIDLDALFSVERERTTELLYPHDETHWSPRAVVLTSRVLADKLGSMGVFGAPRLGPRPLRDDVGAPLLRQAAQPEGAALLLVDSDGAAKLSCLPAGGPPRGLFAGAELLHVFDATWRNGGVVAAALATRPGEKPRVAGGGLALLSPGSSPRSLASGARMARFSPSGDALAFETAARRHVGGGAVVEVGSSHVLELATGKVTELGELVDPRWEADGQRLRATRLTKTIEDRGAGTAMRWTSFRVRWERESGTIETWGRGSAQIPAPVGTAVAWSEDQPGALAPSHCAVRLGRGGHQHPIVGPFCMGIADDRGARWAHDGRWLAFPRPGPAPGERKAGTFFIDVVGIEGGRYPALSGLYARVGPGQASIAGAPGTIWLDWSPSGSALAVQDGADDVRVYDFEAQAIARVGKGTKPMWSPGGGYLLVLAPGPTAADGGPSQPTDGSAAQAFVLPGASRAARIELGPVRDVRWLPPEACGGQRDR